MNNHEKGRLLTSGAIIAGTALAGAFALAVTALSDADNRQKVKEVFSPQAERVIYENPPVDIMTWEEIFEGLGR